MDERLNQGSTLDRHHIIRHILGFTDEA